MAAEMVSDWPRDRSCVVMSTFPAASRTATLCGVGPSFVTTNVTVGPATVMAGFESMKSITVIATAPGGGVAVVALAAGAVVEDAALQAASAPTRIAAPMNRRIKMGL